METKKELYDQWVNKVMEWSNQVGPNINKHVATMQAKPFFNHQSEILFLGINPAEDGGYIHDAILDYLRRFYEGNCYPPEVWGDEGRGGQKRWNWIFNPDRSENSFRKAGWGEAVKKGSYLFFNIIFFGTPHGGTDFNYEQVKEISAKFTAEAITQIFQPKCVICFSVDKVFYPLNRQIHFNHITRLVVKHKNGTTCRFKVMRGDKDGIVYYGMPHISAARGFSKADCDAIIAAIHQDLQSSPFQSVEHH